MEEFAFVQTLPMWLFQDSLLLIIMPRYLLSVSVFRVWPWSWYLLIWGGELLVIGRTLYFWGWNSIFHFSSHAANRSRSCWREVESPGPDIAMYIMVSLAKSQTVALTSFGRSFRYTKNGMGPVTEPWGTPLSTRAHPEWSPLHTTLWDHWWRKSTIQLWICPVTP